MAQRRMFSPEIVGGEEFKTMPMSSQALYFHLGMDADDDGFIQPKLLMRAIGFTDDDLKVLLAKRFLLEFGNGVVVIKHWLIHNMIRADRYKPTRYIDEKESLFIKENKAYTDRQPNGNQMAPQVRLGKVRSLTETKVSEQVDDLVFEETDEDGNAVKKRGFKPSKFPQASLVMALFQRQETHWKVNPYIRAAAQRLYDEKGVDKITKALDFYEDYKINPHCPTIYSPKDLEEKWTMLQNFKQRNV